MMGYCWDCIPAYGPPRPPRVRSEGARSDPCFSRTVRGYRAQRATSPSLRRSGAVRPIVITQETLHLLIAYLSSTARLLDFL